MKIRLLTNQMKSGSLRRVANALSDAVGYKVWRSRYPRPRRVHYVYGGVVNKCNQYRWFAANNVPCPEFTFDKATASSWVSAGHTVFCRTLTLGSEGRGIVIADTVDQLVNAPVYTKYLKKKREFRVHVFRDKVVRVLEKRKRRGWEDPRETRVRNTANGYVFCRDVENIPEGLADLALRASKVTQSDFRGVDIGYNEAKNLLFVIEVNSAPGIEGSNVADYVQAIRSV